MSTWEKFINNYHYYPALGLAIDFSRLVSLKSFPDIDESLLNRAHQDMLDLESGKIANPDENRMVGHYWLRTPELAPKEITTEINKTLQDIKEFAAAVHSGKISSSSGEKFNEFLIVGVGGSALGPQFINNALSTLSDPIKFNILDNTDPDGIYRVLSKIKDLSRTLVLIISKSGSTPETANGKIMTENFFLKNNLDFSKQAIAITGVDSKLYQEAIAKKWLKIFPMWDWVGGRTSEWSAVGLVPAALQGIDIDAFLDGGRQMDALSRKQANNPAILLATAWYQLGEGNGNKDMVIIPYKDRLEFCSRYMQQLVMESLGKLLDLDGKRVEQGISVFGNKGSTDQHAYVQQLRDGKNNFFAVLIEVLKDLTHETEGLGYQDLEVRPGVYSGDYLNGFYQGTRVALSENARSVIGITLDKLDAFALGSLIALFERAVSFYASMININAYHQPGVEAGKKAAEEILALQAAILKFLGENKDKKFKAEEIANTLKVSPEYTFRILRHLAANNRIMFSSESLITQSLFWQ